MARNLDLIPARWLDWTPASSTQILGIGSLIGGAISGLGSLAGGIMGSSSATQAAQIQAQAANQAAQLQYQMFQQMQGNLQPWINTGVSNLQNLDQLLPGLINPTSYGLQPNPFTASSVPFGTPNAGAPGGTSFAPSMPFSASGPAPGQYLFSPTVGFDFQPTMAQLQQTPGYQFALTQGLQATANQNAALGRAGSGAMGRGLVNYAEGLASTTYQNQFNNWLNTLQTQYNMFSGQLGQQYGIYSGTVGQQQGIWNSANALALQRAQQTYNMLGGLAGTGQNAAVNTGTAGLNAGSTIGNLLTSGAAAQAGGVVGSTNALTSGFTGAGNAVNSSLMNFALMNSISNSGGGNNPLSLLLGGNAAAGVGSSLPGGSAAGFSYG